MRARVLAITVLLATAAAGTGRTAPADVVTLNVPGRSNATPSVTASGSTVAVAWGATADGATDVYVSVSHDDGRTFSVPVRVNAVPGEARLGGELPPRVAMRKLADGLYEITVLWTARGQSTEIKAARSVDGGRTFAPPVVLQRAGAPGDRGWPALALDESGTAHAIWLDHRGLAARDANREHANHKDAPADGALMAQRSALFYAAFGERTSGEHQLTPGVCYCCKTALAVAPGGALYAAWRHVYPGNLRDIAFTLSRDGGRSFAPPARVSEDGWQLNGCPDDGPAMAIDGAGTVHVIWPTVLGGPQPEGALFYATTHDGERFTPRLRVPTFGSPKPAHPQIAVNARGGVAFAWDEVIAGTRSAFARLLTAGTKGEPVFGEAIKLNSSGPAMYPAIAATPDAHVVVWTAGRPGSSVIKVRRL